MWMVKLHINLVNCDPFKLHGLICASPMTSPVEGVVFLLLLCFNLVNVSISLKLLVFSITICVLSSWQKKPVTWLTSMICLFHLSLSGFLFVCSTCSYGMRYIAKVLKSSLHEKFPDATEDELLKVDFQEQTTSHLFFWCQRGFLLTLSILMNW